MSKIRSQIPLWILHCHAMAPEQDSVAEITPNVAVRYHRVRHAIGADFIDSNLVSSRLIVHCARMVNSDRAFRALARSQPQVIEGLLLAVAPGVIHPGTRLVQEDLTPTQLDALPPEMDADFATRAGPNDLIHIECQGYRDGRFEERAVWYHIAFALRHRGKRRVRTVAVWLIRPPRDYSTGDFRVHDIAVKVTTVVLEDIPASVLLADARTACFAAGAALEGRKVEELCIEVAASLRASNATFAERHMAAVAALMRGRYKEMVMAMENASLGPVIIEDLVRYGEDLGIERGLVKGLRAGLRRVLAARKLDLTAEQEQRIESCTEAATLEHWLDQASLARTAAEALQ